MAVGADTQTPTAIQSAINSPSWLDPATDSCLTRLRQHTASGLSHRQPPLGTGTSQTPPSTPARHGATNPTHLLVLPLHFPHILPTLHEESGRFSGRTSETRKRENRWKYKKTRHFWRVCKWSRGALNPGPVTVPSFFYVRSLLATEGDFSAPINIADNRWRA